MVVPSMRLLGTDHRKRNTQKLICTEWCIYIRSFFLCLFLVWSISIRGSFASRLTVFWIHFASKEKKASEDVKSVKLGTCQKKIWANVGDENLLIPIDLSTYLWHLLQTYQFFLAWLLQKAKNDIFTSHRIQNKFPININWSSQSNNISALLFLFSSCRHKVQLRLRSYLMPFHPYHAQHRRRISRPKYISAHHCKENIKSTPPKTSAYRYRRLM